MTNYIPTLIIDKVIYPGESVSFVLKQPEEIMMIQQSMLQQKNIGIVAQINGEKQEYGTVLVLHTNTFKAQTLMVEGVGEKVFRVLEWVQQEKARSYSGAIVSYPENTLIKIQPQLSKLILEEVKRFYTVLNIESMVPEGIDWNAYSIAHRLGLSVEQEYVLLTTFNEIQRLEYIRRYLKQIVPEVHNIESIRNRINLN